MTGAVATSRSVAAVPTYVVRVWLPDRPGALGQVASRIGAVRGDVVGIDILERGGGRAVDELVVHVPGEDVVDLLVAEIGQVDGVAVEEVRRVVDERPDGGLHALSLAAELAESDPGACLDLLCRHLHELLDAQWVLAVRGEEDPAPVVAHGEPPELSWVLAFLAGSRHLGDDAHAGGPADLAWACVTSGAADRSRAPVVVVVGRAGRPIHTRERQQMALLCRVAGARLT